MVAYTVGGGASRASNWTTINSPSGRPCWRHSSTPCRISTNATIGIIVCDKAGLMVSANELAGQLFGYAPAALLGQAVEVLVPDATGRHHEQL
ncbi:PAS domain S-box protein, partial [Hymenobacter amundsenii]|uniref:PAS domain S-box protein n=1 Tax=Hymenobacter amundsenii TaxID=2006685 RepID=UPI001F5B4ADB